MHDANTQAVIWHAVLDRARRAQLGILVISHDAPLLERVYTRSGTLGDARDETS